MFIRAHQLLRLKSGVAGIIIKMYPSTKIIGNKCKISKMQEPVFHLVKTGRLITVEAHFIELEAVTYKKNNWK